MQAKPVSSLELYNLLQAQKNWPSGGSPVLLDARSAAAFTKRMIRGAHSASVTAEGAVAVAGAPRCWWDQTVCVYGDAEEGAPEENALLDALSRDGQARALLVLTEPFGSFRKAFPFLSARGDSSKASKRPSYPSCIVPDLLYFNWGLHNLNTDPASNVPGQSGTVEEYLPSLVNITARIMDWATNDNSGRTAILFGLTR